MRGLTDEQKAEARRAFESGEAMAAIAKRMGIHRNALNRLKGSEGWDKASNVSANVSLTHSDVQQRVSADIIDIASRRIIERPDSAAIIEQVADDIAESVKQHGKLSKLLMTYAEQMLENGIAGKIIPGEKQSRADVFNAIISGVGRAVEKSRDIAGLKAGQISARADAAKKPSVLKLVIVDEQERESQAS